MVIREFRMLGRTYRHVNRFREIITVFAKHGFGDLFSRLQLDRQLGTKFWRKKTAPEVERQNSWERIRLALESLGPTFVKLGQILSNRPDLLPRELTVELEKLQDAAAPAQGEWLFELLEKELGGPWEDYFQEFEVMPLACASIAQVHRARLRDGSPVAVKIQRPDIEKTIATDLEILMYLARLAEKHFHEMDVLDPVGIVEEFEKAINKELNFRLEAANMARFRQIFRGDNRFQVPRLFPDLCSEKMLTMELIKGVKVSQVEKIRAGGWDPVRIARQGAQIMLEQIFEHGFFHADPHPGNILVMDNHVLCFLDFGMVGHLSEKSRVQLGAVLHGIVRRDANRITRSLLMLSGNRYRGGQREKMEKKVAELVDLHFYAPGGKVKVADFLNDLMDLFVAHRLKMPSDFYLLLKTLIITEGTARKLNPDFTLVDAMRPYARRMIRHYLNPKGLAKNVYGTVSEMGLMLRDFPEDFRDVMEQIRQGRIKIDIRHKGLEPMLRTHDQISNRIAFAIVLAALVIGSSLIVHSKIPPTWHEVSIVGIIGYVAAGLIGFWLLISILRHGRM